MTKLIVALLSGAVFGVGLAVSGMIDPVKVLGFLDVFGSWDPSLAFVMGGALVITTIVFVVVKRRPAPLWHDVFHIPENTAIDSRLIIGSSLFGIGWGLVGLCPGPALSNLLLGAWQPIVFVAAMVVGMLVQQMFFKKA